MLIQLAHLLQGHFGPARLLGSNFVLILVALYAAFFLSVRLLPKLARRLPQDRGRAFTIGAQASIGKPTGTGLIFITIFALVALIAVPLNLSQGLILALTWLCMLSGYLDDRSTSPWGEYRKAVLDLAISAAAGFVLYYAREPIFWLPFTHAPMAIGPGLYIAIATILIWVSINTTNCSDGVDGLSGALVLLALFTMGIVFYLVLGHKDFASYLLVPHLKDGASWAILTFCLAGALMGYLWHNAHPSKMLMGDAGSRALGFFIGASVMVTGNPALILAIAFILLINGGTGLLKVALLRFFGIRIFADIRFPLHDHMKKERSWSAPQILVKYVILQLLVMMALIGIILKVR